MESFWHFKSRKSIGVKDNTNNGSHSLIVPVSHASEWACTIPENGQLLFCSLSNAINVNCLQLVKPASNILQLKWEATHATLCHIYVIKCGKLNKGLAWRKISHHEIHVKVSLNYTYYISVVLNLIYSCKTFKFHTYL